MQCIHYVLVVAILLSVNGGYSTNIDASVSTSSASKTPSVHNNFIKPTLHAIHTPSNFSNTALSDSASASASPNSSPPNSRYPFDLGNFLSHAKRVKRQSNNPLFGEFLHKMSVIARLANTILLQSDLINKTEMHYKIGELLNIGQLDIVFLKNMNTTHMLEFMEVVNKTISEIGKDVSDGENAVIYLYEMQNSMKDLPAIDKFPSRTDFSNKINELREKFEWAQFNESWPPLRKVSTVLNALNGFTNGSSTTKQMNEDVKLFTNVLDSIEYAKPFIIASNQHLTALSSFKDWNLEVRRSVMDQPERLVFSLYFRNELQKMLNASVESKYSISNKYKLIDDLKKNMQNVGDDFQTFKTNFLQYSNQPSADLRGFQALNRLSSEINEDWMDNALGMNQERRRKLIHSLNPIFALKNNSKLSNFSLSTDYKTGIAIEDMYLIADFLRERKGNSKDYDYSYTLERCLKDVGEIGWNEVSGALQSPKYSREAAEQFSILLDTKLLYEGLQPLIDDFNSVSSIINKYKDSHSSDLQFKVLTRVFDELKTSGSMEKLKKSVDRLMEFSNKFDAREFQNSLYRFLTWNEDLEGAMKSKFANEEYKFNKCFRDHEHDISMGYHDVRLLQNLRNFGEEGVNHVNAFIEKLADMKKLIDEQETTLILKNTNFNVSWEKLKTIDGAIVAKIDNAVESVKNLIELNKMEFVNKPEKMRDAIEYTNYGVDKSGTKLELEQKWKLGTGNLAFRSSSNYFKEALEKINFRKMKNISNVSVFFKELEGIPNMNFDFNSLISVLNYYIPIELNDTRREGLYQIRSEFIKISSMDLDFAKHFKSAADAFKKFGDFLDNCFTEDKPEDQDKTANAKAAAKADEHYIYIIISCVLFVVFVSAVVSFISWKKKWLCFRKEVIECEIIDNEPAEYPPPLTQDIIVIVIVNQIIIRTLVKFEQWMQLLNYVKSSSNSEERGFPYIPLDPRKYFDPNIRLMPYTALQSIRLHGNRFRTRIGTIFYAMQSPMEATNEHDDTREEFLELIVKDSSEYIIMAQDSNTSGIYYHQGVGSAKFGRFNVMTESETQFGGNSQNIVVRQLKITDGKKKLTRSVKQFQIKNWAQGQLLPPISHAELEMILTECSSSTTPVIVHSPSGTGPTMLIIGMEYISRNMECNEQMTFDDAFKRLVDKRYSSFNTWQEIGWLQCGVVYCLSVRHGVELSIYHQMNNSYLDMAVKGNGLPKGVKN
ncbi:hypothetical protein GCK72_011696 [Caenorhabditis remanei]|uniref:Tyrosine-protein phosphatase domain-containing protein n=1 Tax=Caenorhabditis remanei TaxID=31234 RepID=A0A6A5H6H0_CAERE|nr:hypothetical protein GCK72_011696 [Caenorhabditis remanei]KAF1763430.1 hypothetical protein GCK72_011696 [Caenorhabditis remanei]